MTPRPVVRRSPEPAAWALPPVHRFDGRAANDRTTPHEKPPTPSDSRWIVIAAGGLAAALLGALLGGALAV